MNSMYCRSCGEASKWDVTKPRFCNSCGLPFSGQVAVAQQTPPKPQVKVAKAKVPEFNDEEGDFEDDDGVTIPVNFKKLDISIEVGKPIKETIGSLAGTPIDRDNIRQFSIMDYNPEKQMEEFKKEGAAIRPK